MSEARAHPHNVARGTFTEVEGAPQPAPAPRFSRTPGAIERTPGRPRAPTPTTRSRTGASTAATIAELKEQGAIA